MSTDYFSAFRLGGVQTPSSVFDLLKSYAAAPARPEPPSLSIILDKVKAAFGGAVAGQQPPQLAQLQNYVASVGGDSRLLADVHALSAQAVTAPSVDAGKAAVAPFLAAYASGGSSGLRDALAAALSKGGAESGIGTGANYDPVGTRDFFAGAGSGGGGRSGAVHGSRSRAENARIRAEHAKARAAFPNPANK